MNSTFEQLSCLVPGKGIIRAYKLAENFAFVIMNDAFQMLFNFILAWKSLKLQLHNHRNTRFKGSCILMLFAEGAALNI